METYDVVIIGAGHNGLVCAAYLLKEGYSVALLEKREIPGGAATTEALMPDEAPGFTFNRCAIDHEFIHLGPVVQELELAKYGLDYLFCDPTVFCPHPDGRYFLSHRSLDKTCADIAQFNARDAVKYREFIDFWQRFTKAIQPVFNAPPQAILDILGNYDLKSIQNLLSILGGPHQSLDLIRTMLTSPKDLLEEYFDSEFIRAPLARLASEFGAPPSQKTISVGGMMMSMRHNPGMARPRGGTGALVQALVKAVRAKGGALFTNQTVSRILIENKRAVGVEVENGKIYRAKRGVISNIDAKRVFMQLITAGEVAAVDNDLRERLDRRIVNNNETILRIDCALSEAPRFEHHNHRDDYLIGSVLIADSVRQVEIVHQEPAIGNIPLDDPSFYAVVPTMRDPSMAPAGKHTLWVEFFAPYQIAGAEGTGFAGTGWTDALKDKVADRVIDKLADYAPNIKQSIIARNVESPAELGDRLGAYKGNYYHVDMTLDQMVFFRPLPEIANYTTPIEGLFLTGAGTHPGGAISGMPGRNCARTFLNEQRPVLNRLKELGKSAFPAIANNLSR
ncbi:MAG: beta-carotene ketolase CrtO [Cyanobacteria bacterium J06627_28]